MTRDDFPTATAVSTVLQLALESSTHLLGLHDSEVKSTVIPLKPPTMTSAVSPFARSTAFEESLLSAREQTVGTIYYIRGAVVFSALRVSDSPHLIDRGDV